MKLMRASQATTKLVRSCVGEGTDKNGNTNHYAEAPRPLPVTLSTRVKVKKKRVVFVAISLRGSYWKLLIWADGRVLNSQRSPPESRIVSASIARHDDPFTLPIQIDNQLNTGANHDGPGSRLADEYRLYCVATSQFLRPACSRNTVQRHCLSISSRWKHSARGSSDTRLAPHQSCFRAWRSPLARLQEVIFCQKRRNYAVRERPSVPRIWRF
jgi:hypothetical protein